MTKTLGDITNELTKKVLEPAKADAANILKSAQAEADKIIAEAKAEAQKTRQQANREIENLKKQMNVDLETACRNFLILVKERLEKAVVEPVLEEEVRLLFNDRQFLEKIMLEIITGYARHIGKEQHIEVLLPEARKTELEAWFIEKFRHRVEQPLDVRFTDKISFGFKIGSARDGSHINFSDGLIQVFSEFCSPRFRKYFFSQKES